MLSVALPKGRLGEKAYALLEKAGYACPEILEDSRKLIFTSPDGSVSYFWVKPSDVGVYVERGAADLGVVGKDILLESQSDVYELLDLGIGKCRLAVAAPNGFQDDGERTLRIATKFVNVARRHYARKSRDIDIIKLNGSIELAPIVGLSDCIVDIVETGTTLRENNLSVIETIEPVSARLIANKASYSFKHDAVEELMKRMSEGV